MSLIAELNSSDKVERLKQIVAARINGNNWMYLIINHIDPDALGAAFGMKHFFKRIGVDRVRILYCGDAGNDQNRFIINDMGLMEKMSPLSEIFESFTERDVFALFDSCSSGLKTPSES